MDMLNTFLYRWRTLSGMQQLVIIGVAALILYGLLSSGDMMDPARLAAVSAILLLALPLHELAHAATAVALGDDTPRLQGRLTLNPLAHLDPVGSILILLTGFGWAKPVQWNPYNIRVNRRLGAILVSVAGPASNLLLAVLSIIIYGFLESARVDAPVQFLVWFTYINVLLAVFNMIPIPPLDGSHVLFALLPGNTYTLQAQLSQFGFLILMGLILLVPGIVQIPTEFVMSALISIFL
jgi:Zn-dependent protease